MEFEYQSDEAFIEEVESDWEILKKINAHSFPKLLAIAKRCQSTPRIEEENEWLRKRMDDLTTTNFGKENLKKT